MAVPDWALLASDFVSTASSKIPPAEYDIVEFLVRTSLQSILGETHSTMSMIIIMVVKEVNLLIFLIVCIPNS